MKRGDGTDGREGARGAALWEEVVKGTLLREARRKACWAGGLSSYPVACGARQSGPQGGRE